MAAIRRGTRAVAQVVAAAQVVAVAAQVVATPAKTWTVALMPASRTQG